MLVTSKEMILEARKNGLRHTGHQYAGRKLRYYKSYLFRGGRAEVPGYPSALFATGQYAGDDWFAETAKYLANKVSVPVAIHLDHGNTFETCIKALSYGFTSIMLDCSAESIEDNVLHTNEVIKVMPRAGSSGGSRGGRTGTAGCLGSGDG